MSDHITDCGAFDPTCVGGDAWVTISIGLVLAVGFVVTVSLRQELWHVPWRSLAVFVGWILLPFGGVLGMGYYYTAWLVQITDAGLSVWALAYVLGSMAGCGTVALVYWLPERVGWIKAHIRIADDYVQTIPYPVGEGGGEE